MMGKFILHITTEKEAQGLADHLEVWRQHAFLTEECCSNPLLRGWKAASFEWDLEQERAPQEDQAAAPTALHLGLCLHKAAF